MDGFIYYLGKYKGEPLLTCILAAVMLARWCHCALCGSVGGTGTAASLRSARQGSARLGWPPASGQLLGRCLGPVLLCQDTQHTG